VVDILGMGVVAVDDLVYTDHFPVPDSKMVARAMQRQGGGLTATAMVAAARLGARAAYIARLGNDDLSRSAIAELEAEGVDCSGLLFHEDARPYHSVIIVDVSTGSRTIIYTANGVMPIRPDEITEASIAGCRLLFFDHHVVPAARRALEIAHARGIPVVADVENEREPGVRELLPQIDHLIVGIELAARLSGEAEPVRMVQALAGGHACLAVTAGDRGCWYGVRGEPGAVHHLPAFRVPVADTTGCGDVFHGAYAAALTWGEKPRGAIRIATGAAGLKATRPGGRSGIPDRARLKRFLAEHEDEDRIVAA
jgi:sulfofructose kinase